MSVGSWVRSALTAPAGSLAVAVAAVGTAAAATVRAVTRRRLIFIAGALSCPVNRRFGLRKACVKRPDRRYWMRRGPPGVIECPIALKIVYTSPGVAFS